MRQPKRKPNKRNREKQAKKISPYNWISQEFGCVTKMSKAIGYPINSIMKWKMRGNISCQGKEVVLKAAKEMNLDITGDDLILGKYSDEKVKC